MVDKKNVLIPIGMATGVILGVALGYWAPQTALALDFLGKIFAGGLKILIIPIMLIGTVVGVSALGDMRKLGRVTGRILTYFLATTGIALVIGLALVMIMQPGAGALESIPETNGVSQIGGLESISRLLGTLIPGDLIQSLARGRYLGLVLLALFLGTALGTMGVRARTAISFLKGINEGLMKLVNLLLFLAPVGLLSLTASAVAENHSSLAEWSSALGWYLAVVIIALVLHGGVVLSLILKFFGHRSPLETFRKMGPALLAGLGTGSSAAAYPITYEAVVDRCKIDARAASLALPLGTVVNINGSIIATVVAAIFVAQAVGEPLGLLQMLGLALVAIILSIGGAGIPSIGLASMPFVLYAIGLTPEQSAVGMAVIYAGDWLIDRLRAPVNIWGDVVGAAFLAESFEMKTARRQPSRERSPIRTGRGRDQSRDRSSGRRDERSGPRRSRPDSSSGDRERRTPDRTRTQAPSGSNDTRGRGRQKGPTPFDLKSDGAATLEGIESGRTPASSSKRPESVDSERKAPSRTSSRGESSGRSQSRTGRAPSRRTDSDSSRASAGRDSSPKSGIERTRGNDRRPRREAPVSPPVESTPVVEKPAEVTPPTPPTPLRIGSETVARELAQVSAQLRQTESVPEPPARPEPKPTAPTAPKSEPKADQAELTLKIEDQQENEVKESTPPEPVQQFGRSRTFKGAALKAAKKEAEKESTNKPAADKAPKVEPAAKAPAPVAEAPKPVTPSVEKPLASASPASPSPEETPPAPETSEVPKESASTEEVSFGRTKKKRTRR